MPPTRVLPLPDGFRMATNRYAAAQREKTMTTTKVPDDASAARPALRPRSTPPNDSRDLVRSLEVLYEAGIISTTEFEEVLEGWSRYLRQH